MKANPPNPATKLLSERQNLATILSAKIGYFDTNQAERKPLESFIRQVYKKYYKADIEHFYPNLIAIETYPDKNQALPKTIKAVAGVRCAGSEALFSEYYLQQSLEAQLQAVYNKPIDRQLVVEVGNLAPEAIGQMRWLITTLTGFLYSAGFEYIVFTLVPAIYNAFKRMNIPLEPLAEARHECLPEAIQHQWGLDYYKKKPMVLSGNIVEGFASIKHSVFQSHREFIPLFEQACVLGEQQKKSRKLEQTIRQEQVA